MPSDRNEPPSDFSVIVPCQECLGLGRYWDRVGLTLKVCAVCNGTGTDEAEADDE